MRSQASAAAGRSPGVAARCFGRERELATLNELARIAVCERSGQVATIVGPAGIGKSYLVTELARHQRALGMATYECHARAADPPYACVAELADAVVLGLRAEGAPFPIIDEGLDLSICLRHPPTGEEEEEDEGGNGMARPASRLAVFEQARAFFAHAGHFHDLGVILALHDLHVVDDATHALIAYLARSLASPPELSDGHFPGLLVLTGREIPGLVEHEVIELAPLDAGALRAYLSSPLVVERLLGATGGVPGRLETLVGLCPSSSELVSTVVSGLPPRVAWLARALALLARPATEDLLARLVDGAAELVEELAACPLVRRRATPVGPELGYARESDREAVVTALDHTEERELHLALGRALASGGAGEDDRVAEHLLLGGAGREGTERALAAATRLHAHFAYERALSLLQLVGKYAAPEEASRAAHAVQRMTARTAELAGDYGTALVAVDAQLERLDPSHPERAVVLTSKGRLHLLRGELALARGVLESGLALASQGGDVELAAEANAALAEVELLDARHDQAVEHATRALDARGVGRRAVAARLTARNIVGRVHLERAEYAEAAREFSAAAIEARAHSMPQDAARALLNLGIATLRAGRYAAAEEHYRDALILAEQACDLRQRAFCMQNLGVLAQWRRDWPAAFDRYQQAMRAFQKLGNRPWLAWVLIDLGDLYLDLGDVSRAGAMADTAARLLDLGAPTTVNVILTHFRGRVAMHRGELDEAARLLEAADAMADTAGACDERDLIWIYRAQLLCARGEAGRALELLDRLSSRTAPRLVALRDCGRAQALLSLGYTQDAVDAARASQEVWLELCDDEGRLATLLVETAGLVTLGQLDKAARARELARQIDASLRRKVPAEQSAMYGRDALRLRILAGAAA